MAGNQLAIINKERKENFSFYGETLTFHPISVSTYKNYGEHVLEEFSLLDDPRIKCLPKLNSQSDVFCICFLTEVSPINEYEISLYYFEKHFELIHVKTVYMVNISKSSKCETKMPNLEFVTSPLSESYILCTKICRKDDSYIFLKKPSTLLPSQITDCSLLFENNALTNFKIVVEDREFLLHKEILAAKSPVFLAMFDSEMKEKKENLMIIEDLEADVFREMLRYIYTNNVHDLNVHVEKLFRAADKYNIPKLKLLCVGELTRSLKKENAIHVLHLADQYRENTLKELAMWFIQRNMDQILQTEDYKTWRHTELLHHLVFEILEAVANFVKK